MSWPLGCEWVHTCGCLGNLLQSSLDQQEAHKLVAALEMHVGVIFLKYMNKAVAGNWVRADIWLWMTLCMCSLQMCRAEDWVWM